MNIVNLVGRLVRDPELRYTAGTGTPAATFTVAISAGKDKNGKEYTDFVPVKCWGKTAENVANYMTKGYQVAVTGSFKVDTYDKDGEKRSFSYVNIGPTGKVEFLTSKKDIQNKSNPNNSEPVFNPTGLDINDFQAMDDDGDIPF